MWIGDRASRYMRGPGECRLAMGAGRQNVVKRDNVHGSWAQAGNIVRVIERG